MPRETDQREYWERASLAKRRAPTHPVVETFVTRKIALIRQYVDIRPETRLLDVGCGNGHFTYHFAKICHAFGVDLSETLIRINPVKNKAVMDAAALEFEDNSFDVVFSNALLHHVPDVGAVLREMKRVSRETVIVFEPNRNNPLMLLFCLLIKEERRALKHTMRYVRGLLEREGLRVVHSCTHGAIVPNKVPPFLLPLVRLFDRRFPLGLTHVLIARSA